jgi:diguanylate cyclase (GGDEF)-like protein
MDQLRMPDYQDNLEHVQHIEASSLRGLVLPCNLLQLGSFQMPTLKEISSFWFQQASQLNLLQGMAVIVTDEQLILMNALRNGSSFVDSSLLAPGASWSRQAVGSSAFSKCAELLEAKQFEPDGHDAEKLRGVYSYALPIFDKRGSLLGTFGLLIPNKELASIGMSQLLILGQSFYMSSMLLIEKRNNELLALQKQSSDRESKKRDVLFEAAKKLHAKIDVDSVLREVIDSIASVYPSIHVDLLLSQDNHSTNLPVKPLNFQGLEDDMCTRAFMEGHLIFEPSEPDKVTGAKIAAPLSGKQGVYGVLYLRSDEDFIDSTDILFISMLADTAGSAFENAKLYEQSNLLINELRLINEITKRLNQSLRLNEIFNFASSELLSIFGADYCCILQSDKNKEKLIVEASNLPAIYQENFTLDQGFSGVVYKTKEPLIISDYWANSNVKSKLMEMTSARSLIASPITVNGEVVGVILVVHGKPNFFSYDNFKLLQVLSGHIGLAMTNASLHAEVRRMVITDNLTGLYVRHYLDEQVNTMQKKDFCGSLIVVDIDNFKRVNDTYGHQVGDKILIQVSNIIKSSIRDSDVAARWGGEELAVYLPQVAKDQSLRIAERIRQRVMNETSPQVTVSCGVSDWNWEEDKISVESLFYKADMALYEAKHNGRNQIKIG